MDFIAAVVSVCLKYDGNLLPSQMLSPLAHTVHLMGIHVVGLHPTNTWAGEELLEMSFCREKTCRVSLCSTHKVGSICVSARACVCVSVYVRHALI